MKLLVISSSPNKDGLTAACTNAAIEGVHSAGSIVQAISLNDLQVGKCQACDTGWGTCLSEHRCQIEDDFQALHAQVNQADGLILVTPVYWGEMSKIA